MKIIAYYRVSTKKQAKSGKKFHNGLGLEAQVAAVANFAARNEGDIIAEYREVEKGRKNDRPELLRAISHCKNTKATLVVAKLDRLSRDVGFTDAMLKSGIEFIACDNPHANRLTIQILAAVAENEAIATSRRTKDALAAAKAQGTLLGSARPGHWEGREHLRGSKKGAKAAGVARSKRAREAYAFVLPQIMELRNGGKSYDEIAVALNEAGHQTVNGVDFNGATVWRIIKRATDSGKPREVVRRPRNKEAV